MKWNELASTSPYRTAVEVREALQHGQVHEASLGLEELIDALSRSDRRALKNHLVRLMCHVLKWQAQPQKRSRSWRATIRNARREIRDIQEETLSLNRAAVESFWDICFVAAKDDAEAEMNLPVGIPSLTWEEVIEKEYELEDQR